MKIYLSLFIISIFLLGFQAKNNFLTNHVSAYKSPLFSSGPPAGRTGAPGELNCTVCHSGTVLDGALVNELVLIDGVDTVSSYTPNTLYTVRTNMNLTTNKKGFQTTVFNASNAFVGNFTAGSNTAIVTSGSKKYSNHKGTSTAGSTPFWEWQWQAPATDAGTITFYMSANNANNNGSDSGDQIYLSQHQFNSTAGIKEKTLADGTNVFQDKEGVINYRIKTDVEEALEIVVLDMNGRIITSNFSQTHKSGGVEGTINLNNVDMGTYFIHFILGNNTASKKIVLR